MSTEGVDKGSGAGPENEWLSWRVLIERAPTLGVPHFQRGHVWEQGNVAALLESMYEGSPCGSLVLWPNSATSEEHASTIGSALVAEKAASVRYWLVDGQQRLRSLVGVLTDAAEDPGAEHMQPLLKAWAARPSFDAIEAEEPDAELSQAGRAVGPWKQGKSWYVALPRLLPESALKGTVLAAERNRTTGLEPFRRLNRNLPSPEQNDKRQRSPPGARGLVPLSWIWRLANPENELFPVELEQVSTAEELDTLAPWGARCISGYAIKWKDLLDDRSPWKAGDGNALEQWRMLIRLLRSDDLEPVRRKLKQLVNGQWFAAGYLPGSNSHSEVVEAYTRINRAGVRVRLEERAYADLMRRSSGVAGELRSYSRRHAAKLWPQPADSAALTEADMKDRWWLEHAAERSFGFTLWIRTVVRALVLTHCEASANGSGWQGPEALERPSLRGAIDKAVVNWAQDGVADESKRAPHPVEAACKVATDVLLLVDEVLAEQVGLDNPMGLPDTRFLMPVIDLLLRHRELLGLEGPAARSRDEVLGQLLLWLACHRYINGPQLTMLLNSLRKGKHAAESIDALVAGIGAVYCQDAKVAPPGEGAGLAVAVREIVRLAGEGLAPQLEEAKTLRSRMVGLLYALERRSRDDRGESLAREFDWGQEGLERGRPKGMMRRTSLPLRARWKAVPGEASPPEAEDLALQRQHMVPFNLARQLVGGPTSPSASSDANSVANLTWLTRRQNSFVGGIGADMLDLRSQGESAENLAARGFMGVALRRYLALYDRWAAGKGGDAASAAPAWNSPETVKLYARFLRARRGRILGGFRAWLRSGEEEFLKGMEELRRIAR